MRAGWGREVSISGGNRADMALIVAARVPPRKAESEGGEKMSVRGRLPVSGLLRALAPG
ncbi:hypothetical protein GCM10023088_13340 [Actinomadura verrucosospora]